MSRLADLCAGARTGQISHAALVDALVAFPYKRPDYFDAPRPGAGMTNYDYDGEWDYVQEDTHGELAMLLARRLIDPADFHAATASQALDAGHRHPPLPTLTDPTQEERCFEMTPITVTQMCWFDAAPTEIVMPFGRIGVPARKGWSAIAYALGMSFYMSRLEGETGWSVDGFWQGDNVIFQNLWGYRCDATNQVVDASAISILESAAAAATTAARSPGGEQGR